MKKDALIAKLKGGENVYGTCITSTSPMWPPVIAGTGIDFVFIDTEHIPLDRSEVARLCQQFRALGVTPIVRIPRPDPFLACQVIDAGAIGVVAPYLESPGEFRELVGATKYRPLKGEKLAALLSGADQPGDELLAYVEAYNSGNLFIANIESVPALDRLDELLDTPGLDGVFIGPHDLSVSMDLPEQYDDPRFEAAVRTIIRKCRERSLAVGIHFSLEPERQIQWVREGANMIVHSFDLVLFRQKLTADLNLIRSAVGDKTGAGGEASIVV